MATPAQKSAERTIDQVAKTSLPWNERPSRPTRGASSARVSRSGAIPSSLTLPSGRQTSSRKWNSPRMRAGSSTGMSMLGFQARALLPWSWVTRAAAHSAIATKMLLRMSPSALATRRAWIQR